jgi:hypothetical protein
MFIFFMELQYSYTAMSFSCQVVFILLIEPRFEKERGDDRD